jgi:hypothetical protein
LPEEKDHFLNEMFSYIEEIAANPTPENKYILAKIIIPQSLGFLQNATNDQERFLNLIEKIAYIDFDSNPEEEIVDKIFFMNQDSYIILKNGRLTLQHGSDPLDRWNFHGNIAFNANKKFVFVDADHLSLDNHSTA